MLIPQKKARFLWLLKSKLMKSITYTFCIALLVACSTWKNAPVKTAAKIVIPGSEPAEINNAAIPGDPLNVHEYTLDNGLKVFVSPNNAEPRIQTLVLVKAGSVHDPSDATGLAHYLEHMLFKGNQKFGTVDYSAEKIELEKIKILFEQLKATNDTLMRKSIYHQIDSISGVAAQYACPNEIDQLFTQIGAKGTNAYTSKEFTGYINDIPNNQLENWLKIETERYTNPVLRLFHTELEAVYEEKNITLDKADRRMSEVFYEAIFPNHNYGQQTTIGTVEHLKSPSMYAIEKYFNTHYVPNNMAVFLAGAIDPDSAFHLVKTHFSQFQPKEVPPYEFNAKHQFTSPVIKTMSSKEAEQLMIGFRFPGASSKESKYVDVIDMLLANSTAGLIDLNVNQQQKAIGAYSYPYALKDYTIHVLGGQPNKGETLDDLKGILMMQIELIKQGKFEDWMLEAVVNDLKKRELTSNRSNRHRVSSMSGAFAKNISWKKHLQYFNELSAITKEEVITFAQKNYAENYVAVYRLQNDSSSNLQVEKPAITPIEVPPGNRSAFLTDFSKQNRPQKIEPVFVEYEKEITNEDNFYYQKNTQDSLFSLSFTAPIGTKNDPNLAMAFEYAQLCGTKEQSLTEINKKWYQLGIDFNMGVGEEETYFSLSGLAKNRIAGIQLMQQQLFNLIGDTMQLNGLKAQALQLRKNSLQNKRHLLWTGLNNYLVYGSSSPYMKSLSNEALLQLSSKSLLGTVQKTIEQVHEIYYYGPNAKETVKNSLPKFSQQSQKKSVMDACKKIDNINQNEIYFYDFDMQQAEILFLHKGQPFNKKDLPVITLFNEYFGGGMSSIVFQEIREKKALAYSVYAGYRNVADTTDPHYVLAYIGTQADKYEESITAILDLMQELPYDSLKFEQAKAAILQQHASNRIAEHTMISAFKRDKKLGYTYDKRKDIYEGIQDLTFEDIRQFFNTHIKGKKYRIAVLGSSKQIDLKLLEKFGKVNQVTNEDIFPY